jgi:hypothetical protein
MDFDDDDNDNDEGNSDSEAGTPQAKSPKRFRAHRRGGAEGARMRSSLQDSILEESMQSHVRSEVCVRSCALGTN